MSKQSITIINLLVFSSMLFLSAPVMAATVDPGTAPALQISNQLLLPPGTPVASASATLTPALEVRNEIWPPHQGVTPPAQTPPQSAEDLQKLQSVCPQTIDAVVLPQADVQVLKTLQAQIDTLARDNSELQKKLKAASAILMPVSGHGIAVAPGGAYSQVNMIDPSKGSPERRQVRPEAIPLN
jgi:hypothetical protein